MRHETTPYEYVKLGYGEPFVWICEHCRKEQESLKFFEKNVGEQICDVCAKAEWQKRLIGIKGKLKDRC